MRKILFILFAAVCLAGCVNDNEPTPPINTNTNTNTNPSTPSTPSTPIEPSKTTFTLKNISEYNTFTFYVVECGEDVELGQGMQYGCNLLPGATKNFTVPDINYFVTCYKTNGMPTDGTYKDLAANEYPLECGIIKTGSVITNQKGRIYLINKTNDVLEVYINGGKYIKPFRIYANDSYTLDVDLGYYNIKLYETDYLFMQDTYEYDIEIGADKYGTDQLEADNNRMIWITE